VVICLHGNKEKLLEKILVNYRDCLSLLETNTQVQNDYYHKIAYCKELINTFEFSWIPQLLEVNGWSEGEYEKFKMMANDIGKISNFLKSAF